MIATKIRSEIKIIPAYENKSGKKLKWLQNFLVLTHILTYVCIKIKNHEKYADYSNA
jgi:hypothetical protein